MPVELDNYRVRLGFKRLFADPRLFENNSRFARSFLLQNGLDPSKANRIIDLGQFQPTDATGNPARTSGTANYNFQGSKNRAEYMENVTVYIEYVDVGTGLPSHEHHRLWLYGNLWAMPFTLENFGHVTVTLEMPDVESLYSMIKEQAQPTTIASMELEGLPKGSFDLALAYLEARLAELGEKDKTTLEIYASRYLDDHERVSLDARLTKKSTDSTVYVILGKP